MLALHSRQVPLGERDSAFKPCPNLLLHSRWAPNMMHIYNLLKSKAMYIVHKVQYAYPTSAPTTDDLENYLSYQDD